MKELNKCPYCGNAASSWCSSETSFEICISCEMVYRKMMPSVEALDRIYGEYYTKESLENKKTRMVSTDTSRMSHVKYIATIVKPGARILDFGAGDGEFAWELQQLGYTVIGVEYSKVAIAAAKSCYGFKFYRSLKELNVAQEDNFDMVIGIEVIEHLPNPNEILDLLSLILQPGGILYLTTPNRSCLKARFKKCRWSEASKLVHLVLFNYKSLKIMLENSGFNKVQYIRFSPLTTTSPMKIILHRALQFFGLYGGLRVIASKLE